ncbi:glycosyltransferase family 4 protein [Cupriavidus campinensis]|uniref:Glycosyltransferase family 4 protein n=1 Tax=Cupriavidus campinensis TaxID=151783 RepID=A0ABY3ENN4_9BURK|nr:glycosyltransferase family 4 protein [Cupriavidus campinensis]TSP12401.1 glycosyltransferase family 4 protein [Cupriavidus campinensis]
MATREKILFCGNSAWGMYQFRRGVLEALIADGYEVHVVAPADRISSALEKMGCVFHAVSMSPQGYNPLEDLRLVLVLSALYRRVGPKVIFHYTIKPNIYGSVAAQLAGTRSIAITTGLGYVFLNVGVVSWVSKLLYRIALRFPQAVWFLNQEDRGAFVSRRLVESSKCAVLPGEGIDLTHFRQRSAMPAESPETFTFLLIARMLWDKGIGEYVDAARQLGEIHKNVRFLLLGPGGSANPSAIPLEQIREWQEDGVIEYLGEATDVRPAIAAADCIVLPSYREGVPRVLLEAAAMERPVIATNVPGCKDIVEDGVNGYLCADRCAADLAAKMAAMIRLGATARREMGRAGRIKVQRDFDEKKVVAHYRSVIRAFA